MGRAPCCDKDGLKKGPWLPEEDQKLVDYIQKNGPGNWRSLPKKAGLQRCGKSCRLRWTNYLRPDIKRGRFSFEEEEAIIQLHSILGNKWSAIAAKLPGRTDNEIKNYWNTHIRKRLLRMGIDPVTHTRRLDFLNLPSIFNNSPSLLQDQQLNLLKLLGLQSLVNPNLLNLATLLSNNQNQNLLLQNLLANNNNINNNDNDNNNNNNNNNQFTNINNTSQIMQNPLHNTLPTCSSMINTPTLINNDTHVIKSSLENYPTKISNNDIHNVANNQSTLVNDQWQSNANMLINLEANTSVQDCDNYQSIMESLLNTLGLNSDNNNNNINDDALRMPYLFSTPCSSQQTPTPPLSTSNSTAYQTNNSSSPTSNEDEIDSYCQNLMNFDVLPVDLFDNALC